MSFDAISWAMDQPVGRSAAKFLLVALADCVNGEGTEEMVCFPSAAHLARRTEQDEKTVQTNLARLRELGFIEDTGSRRGTTKQIIVYRLKTPESGCVAASRSAPIDPQISGQTPPNSGDSEQSGTPPNCRLNTPKFPVEDPQISGQTPPNLGDGTTKEPVKEPVKEPRKQRAKSSFDPMSVELPDWMSTETWSMWVRYRAGIKKPVDVDGARLQLRKLEQYRQQGHDPRLVIEAAVENRWQGLHLPNDGSTLVKAGRPAVSGVAPGEAPWYVQAGFEHPAEAQNAECHIGNFREFSNGQRRQAELGVQA